MPIRTSSSTSTTMLLTLLMLVSSSLAASNMSNQTLVDGALFERYQFLSPGIIMGFSVGFLLIAILYVGISALSSLEVTYGAFEKESGPGSKKQQ